MRMFCNHNWEIITEKEMKSPCEKTTEIKSSGGKIPAWFFESKYICIVKCTKCGKLDKTIESNP